MSNFTINTPRAPRSRIFCILATFDAIAIMNVALTILGAVS